MMARHEFSVAFIDRQADGKDQQAELDRLAAKGWEIVGVSRGEDFDRLYLRRPLDPFKIP